MALFDTYGVAELGFSERLLYSSYSGSCLRIRRATGGETDIGFVSGALDKAAIATYCAGTDGYVVTCYNQGTGSDATQTTQSEQPRICLNGVVDVRSGFAGIGKFIAANTTSLTFTEVDSVTAYQFIVAYAKTDTSNPQALTAGGYQRLATRFFSESAGTTTLNITSSYDAGILSSSAFDADKIVQVTIKTDNFELDAFAEGNNVGSASSGAKRISCIGRELSGTSEAFDDHIFEVVVYTTDKSSDQSAIEADQIAYYIATNSNINCSIGTAIGSGLEVSFDSNSRLRQALKEAYASAPVDVVVIHTLEFRHPNFRDQFSQPTAIRAVLGHQNLEAKLELDAPQNPGEFVTFVAMAFDLSLPNVENIAVPEIGISIDNVSRDIEDNLMLAAASPYPVQVTYRPYLNTDLTEPQMNPPLTLTILSAEADDFRVTARASYGNAANVLCPRETYNTARFPGIQR